ncbi:DUF1365 domain-containing protein [Kitasatospora cheerisanensis]|uniref:DUF1365 domain-containing protein n=1 Tax=Kitasatospora cheerisanensis KCTC 2395 TaxID=1348663 RepID=A0A066ZBR5_9ACTN|nr:DUF1365 domain-containing protein [Kitasatospora cheerisanensis]KDN87746.1 hypothetical protein KCH_03930 [Kitasatospora cheerisanensis KCTC 2395]
MTGPGRRTLPGPWGAALYPYVTTHVRTAPLRDAFRHRGYLWLVDLDRMPPVPRWLRPLARFRPGEAIRRELADFLAGQGTDLAGGSVLMLTQARVLGHVFNPLTVYWCRDAAGRPLCTVAEVHNTYGGRHRYLLRPGPDGVAGARKEFYVSPFFPVAGRYRMRLPEPGDRLDLTVRLELDGGSPFTATLRGRALPAGAAVLLRAALRHPLPTLAVSAHIRYRGIRLWLRGLPVHPRPAGPRGPSGCPLPSPSDTPHEESTA